MKCTYCIPMQLHGVRQLHSFLYKFINSFLCQFINSQVIMLSIEKSATQISLPLIIHVIFQQFYKILQILGKYIDLSLVKRLLKLKIITWIKVYYRFLNHQNLISIVKIPLSLPVVVNQLSFLHKSNVVILWLLNLLLCHEINQNILTILLLLHIKKHR